MTDKFWNHDSWTAV